ncbi:hypothetical protein BDP55DRAFT_625110 [Colletotrichum godetiae]|uniref:NACHT domain-containing protein n=1 Tax=Colletotrichum godetiae TaxID=1209918 RepID=A0AAJ0AYV2_9PEZI|nr:uncharacterized protein BDP55DRAFT_625110 [Colletotrichum godetiae]KAK1700838.1 hypothetical protein BDP55DRAFT_625110 [Colletotrichum godetiae]
MSGLEALGLACNIFQVISFGRETASLVKRVYRDGSVDDALEENAKDLVQLATHVQNLEVPKKPTKQEHQLLEIAKKCQAVARDLTEEIAFVVGHKKKGSLAATIKVATKANWRKRRLDTMERKLNDAERLMQSGLLARICQKADAMQLDLKSIDINLQHFLQQYQQGHRDTSDLISTEMFRTRNHVTHESQKATAQIQSMVDQQSAQLDHTIRSSNQQVTNKMEAVTLDIHREDKRQRFLASFKFPGMNERRNQVSEACKGTFQWVFADDMGRLEDPDNESEWTDTESESSDGSGDSQDNSSVWTDDSEDQDSAPSQDGGIRWDSFIDWLKSGSSIFWCSGKPGSGKSTLMRYIISDPRTRNALEVWSPGALLVSHLFWRPGSLMQQSIRGMFCSIIHQLLANDSSVLDRAISACSSAGQKDSDTDWSTKQLQSLCFSTIEQYSRPICLFLDGLDEVSPDDGVVRLIKTIHELGTVPNVKVCVSSRPEYLIEKHLGHGRYPFIRLQDLTHQDLRIYAESHINFPPKMRKYWGGLEDPMEALVHKAEGVFLWLCLAIKSLNQGLDHKNNSDDLEQRIRSLPAGLSNLYKDMWTRLNDDQLLYRQKAALYLRLVIAKQESGIMGYPFWGPNVFSMMLIATSMADRVLEQDGHMFDPSILITACHRTQREVLIRCAGLLELSESSARLDKATPWDSDQYDTVMPHITDERAFQFIHRSAYDFLSDTSEGQEILSHCKLSDLELQRQILCAWVTTCQLALILNTTGLHFSDYYSRNELHRIFASIEAIVVPRLGQPDYQRQHWMQLMKACERLCRSGRLLHVGGHPINICGHVSQTRFYMLVARYHLMDIFFYDTEYLNLRPETLSELLVETCSCSILLSFHDAYAPSQQRLIAKLLQCGADPNGKFVRSELRFPRMSETPLSLYIRQEGWLRFRSRETWLSYLRTLDRFADHNANFQQDVFLRLIVSSELGHIFCSVDISPHSVFNGWTISFILPASVLVASAVAAYRNLGLSLAQESEHILSLLGSNYGTHSKPEASVVGLERYPRLASPEFCGKLSPEDSDYLCESLIKWLLLGFPVREFGKGLNTFEAKGLDKGLGDIFDRSESTGKTAQDHFIDQGLIEAEVYVDDDGLRYSRDAAKKMAPEWIGAWLGLY